MAFTYDKCGKQFTEKSNLTRHMKTHVDSSQTYSCAVCGKEFKRADHRKRHEEAHDQRRFFECPHCTSSFTREPDLKRHVSNRHKDINEPTSVGASRERSRSPIRRSTERPSVRQPSVQDEPQILPEDPETRTLYLRHWQSIRTRENTGNRVQDRYNFTLHEMTASTFPEMVRRIFTQQSTAFTINLSFGFMLRNVETGESRYYHPSQNNARFFDVPHWNWNEEDLERFLDDLSRHDILEYIRQQRPDTKWVVHLQTNMTFYVYKINNHPIRVGVLLPAYVSNNPGLNNLTGGSHGAYRDNLCFFRCLAIHRGAPVKDLETSTKTYFHQYLDHTELPLREFKVLYLDELPVLERLYNINVFVYELKETEEQKVNAELVRRSPYQYDNTMNLNLYMDHLSYIKDLRSYSRSYACRNCDKLWKHVGMLHRHEKNCKGGVRYKHPGGVYHTTKTVFEELEDEGIIVPPEHRYYPYRATYDIETMFHPPEKVEWVNQHVLLSISVCSNVPEFTEPKCFVSEGNSAETIEDCLQYLTEISQAAYLHLNRYYLSTFGQINSKIDEDLKEFSDEEKEAKQKGHHLYQLGQKLERFLHELPVIGFNSGRYDINAMKIDFFSHLAERNHVKYAMKRNNTFMAVKTEKLKFLDIANYLAPGFRYSQYLKAYGCSEEKGHFPYEWMTSMDKLNVSQLPPHEAFFSRLKNENISAEDYQLCQRVWEDNDMKSMKEFLVWYNNKYVVPMLEAIEKMFRFYKNRHIDMFKDGISVPGLTLKYMFQDLPDYFTLPDEKNKDLYDLYKNGIVGGPSLVFHRYYEKDRTFIRPAEYTDPKPCKSIIGFDANALYLWSIMQDMPTGHFVLRKEETGFRRETPRRYECMAIDWLEWEALQSRQSIRHQGNDSEKLIGKKRLPVDGFCRNTNTVYEFQGCLWHGHRCWMTKKYNGVNPVNGKNLDDLYQRTRDKIDYIKDQGYDVVEMWECQWRASIKRDPGLSRFIENRKRPCDGLITMSEDSILQAVMDEKLFGALEVDIKVPDHLKPTFAEMSPIFKNVDVSRDDIGDHMRQYAVDHDIMTQPRKSLIGSIFGSKIMVISPLLKWYLTKGLVVTRIYQVVEYSPAKCFQTFGEAVSDARRAGDADPEKKIIAETNKLDGNSSYGKTVTNKERHTDVIYCKDRRVHQYLVDPFVRKCNQLNEDTFEVEMSKKTITLDLPMHIGCFVYQYAKLRMLQFYFDFMDVFVDRRDFQYCAMDTDSAYMALSATSLEDVIKPDMHQRYQMEKNNWFPRVDTSEHAAYDKRTPGLFKEEYRGDGIVALCNMTYYCFGVENKFSCKGINKRLNDITKDKYMDVLLSKKSGSGTNRGFRVVDNKMYTYLQERAGFSYFYPKRKVLTDGVSTAPLDI